MTTNVVPIVADAAVSNDITSGNQYSAIVTAKLVSLGFTGFDDFVQQLLASGEDVISALNAETLSSTTIQTILSQNIGSMDFTSLGGIAISTTNLPCYDNFVANMALALAMIAEAAVAGPGAAIGAGIIGIGYAYVTFKQCMKQYN